MPETGNPFLDAALRYAAMGLPVFPCAPGRKTPITARGFHEATTEADTIRTWWTHHPRANVAMPTGKASGLIVLDIDPRHGGDVGLDELQAEHGELPETTEAMTGGGGRHLFFQHPGGHVPCSQGSLGAGIDVKGDGGYVLLPPSRHESGGDYVWELSHDVADVRPVACPAWLVGLLRQGDAETPPGRTSGDTDGNVIGEGQRNKALASLAGGMRRMGMSEGEILAALQVTNQARCRPPLQDREVERIAASISRYEPDAVTVALVEDHYGGMFEAKAVPEKPPDPGPIPEELLTVPGFVADVMQFTLDNAPYPNIGLAFCGAMALQSYLCARKVCTPGDLRSNLYLLALASSGTGKDFPRKVNARVLLEIGDVAALGDKFASGEGIQDALIRSSAMLFQNDEMDGVLRQINLDRENRRESIPNVLLTLYTAANDVYPIRVKAGQKETVHIDQPHLTLFGTATPQYFYESLSHRMLTNGFFARLIIIDVGRRGEGQSPGSARHVPEAILDVARWWAQFSPTQKRGNMMNLHPEPKVVPLAPDAAEAMASLRRMTEAEYAEAEKRQDEVGRTAWSRTCENAGKLALIYACSENHEKPVITSEAMEWASTFAVHQTKRQLFLAQSYVAENPFHAECLKLQRKLHEAGGEMPRRELMRAMRCKAAEFDQIVGTLLQQGDIDPVEIHTRTKTATGYRLP